MFINKITIQIALYHPLAQYMHQAFETMEDKNNYKVNEIEWLLARCIDAPQK